MHYELPEPWIERTPLQNIRFTFFHSHYSVHPFFGSNAICHRVATVIESVNRINLTDCFFRANWKRIAADSSLDNFT